MIKGSVEIEDKDLGMDELMREIQRDASQVDIGIHADEDQQLIVIAAANEFGTEHIPARSFIRSTVDENGQRYAQAAEGLLGRMVDGEISKFQALELMGQLIEADIKKKIVALHEPPNAPATIRRKGSDNPLIDTGNMLQSIRYVIKTESERILGGS